jgi:uncharacterized membrane protein
MDSHAKAAGHPIHQQLIVFPLGLLATAVIFDLLWLAVDNDGLASASYYMIAAGVISGILAAVFGMIDYIAVPPDTRAKRIALLHGVGNALVLALFALSWWLRQAESDHLPTTLAVAVGVAAAGISIITGWLGGELVSRLGVGVADDAHLNASSSFTTSIRIGRADSGTDA